MSAPAGGALRKGAAPAANAELEFASVPADPIPDLTAEHGLRVAEVRGARLERDQALDAIAKAVTPAERQAAQAAHDAAVTRGIRAWRALDALDPRRAAGRLSAAAALASTGETP